MIQIKIDAASLKTLNREISRLRARLPQAIARGLNEGGDKVRTKVQHSLQKQAGLLRYASVTKRVRTMRAFGQEGAPKSGVGPPRPATMSYTIIVQGKPSTKANEFPVRVIKGPGGGVIIKMWGEDHKFQRSFQIAGRSGGDGLRMRMLKPRFPIRGFRGPNLAKEAVKGETASAFFGEAHSVVLPIIEKQISRMLK